MKSAYCKILRLENYRNFSSLTIDTENKPLILIGENGSGKTNILESISLMSSGRGLRAAKLEEICKYGFDNWRVNCLMNSKMGEAEIWVSYNNASSKRIVEFNGSKIPNGDLVKFANIIWLTPQMESIFLDSAGDRRKFFDRIIHNFENSHANILNKYEYYIKERMNLLQQNFLDQNFIKIIEEKIAINGLEIAKNRVNIIDKLQGEMNLLESEFPKADIFIDGAIEDIILKNKDDSEQIEFIIFQLQKFRQIDKESGRTNFGVHRSDFVVTNRLNNIKAKNCSTGQQKAILISIILSQINLIIKEVRACPIILFDEIFVHLDDKRTEYLIDILINLKLQSFITTTDLKNLERLSNYANIYRI